MSRSAATGTTMRLDGSEQYVRWTTGLSQPGGRGRLSAPLGGARTGGQREDLRLSRTCSTTRSISRRPELGYSVKDPVTGSRSFVKQESQTLAARANLEELRSLWTQWVYHQRDVLDRIVDTYNTRYNRTVTRTYDGVASRAITANAQGKAVGPQEGGVRTAALPGLALDFCALSAPAAGDLARPDLGQHAARARGRRRQDVRDDCGGDGDEADRPRAEAPDHRADASAARNGARTSSKAYPTAKLLAFDEKDLAANRRQEAHVAHRAW